MNSHLNLFYEDNLVGVLSEDAQERLSFKYVKEWLESKKAFPISGAPLKKYKSKLDSI